MADIPTLHGAVLECVSSTTLSGTDGLVSSTLYELLVTRSVLMQDPADSTVYNPRAVVPVSSSASNATATSG